MPLVIKLEIYGETYEPCISNERLIAIINENFHPYEKMEVVMGVATKLEDNGEKITLSTSLIESLNLDQLTDLQVVKLKKVLRKFATKEAKENIPKKKKDIGFFWWGMLVTLVGIAIGALIIYLYYK